METGNFKMTILGRTIEHLGTQMYKHRAPSIAELIANCWDAGAKAVRITMPTPDTYDRGTSAITILDDGEGMEESAVQDRYLVVGLNRCSEGGEVSHDRRVMGRKGIGKLAGFGLAEKVTVTTWTKNAANAIRFSMSLKALKGDVGKAHGVFFPWHEVEKQVTWARSGTLIELSELRHQTPLAISSLKETLARRFSRTTRREMTIRINDEQLAEPTIDAMHNFPEGAEYEKAELPSG